MKYKLRHIMNLSGARCAAFLSHRKGITMRLSDYFVSRYVPERLLEKSPRTSHEYEISINRLSAALGRSAEVSDLTTGNLYRFRAAEREGRSPETVNKHLRQLLAVANHAHKRNELNEIPSVEKLKTAKRAPVAWTPDEMREILAAAASRQGRIKALRAWDFWPALILTLYDTGARISAVMACQWDWLSGPILTIPAEVQKQNADQRYTLRGQTLEAIAKLRTWQKHEDGKYRRTGLTGPLFAWPYDPSGSPWKVLNRHYREILDAAGLPTEARDLFHKIRRTTATRIADSRGRVAAQSYLGHSSAKVTARYIDATQVRAEDAARDLPDI